VTLDAAGRKLVFIPDRLSEDALGLLKENPEIEVDYRPGLSLSEKKEAAREASALIVRSETQVDREFLSACHKLEIVVRAGVGVDNIDVEAATRKGVVVQNVPEGNVRSAAEHTVALILALSRNIPEAHRSVKEGKWERARFTGVEVQGKTLGVVGLGKIGSQVVTMAAGLGFKVLAYDPFVAPRKAQELGVELVGTVGELASRSDYLTVHVPRTEGTQALIGKEVLARARRGIRIINCARGGIIDEAALLDALEDGRVGGAALDVFEKEPPGDSLLLRHPRVIATPHLGASTREAQENVALAAARQVVDYLLHRKLHSPVNAVTLEPELREVVEPYMELAVRLGRLQARLLEGNPERIVVKYFGDIFEPKIQSYLSSAVLEGFLVDRSAQPVNWINARALAKDQGLAVEESTEGRSRYFVNLIRVELSDSAGKREIGGSIRGRRGMRLVSLDGYQFDAVLEGTLLIVRNQDRPGMIATTTQVLAAHNINIAYISLGRDRTGGTAISLLNLDDAVPPEVLEELRSRDGILWARVVKVG
jgi:D-3-phosphoglycerate dehydrogenase